MKGKNMSIGKSENKLIAINKEVNGFLDIFREFKVASKETFDEAALHLETIVLQKKVITEYWAPLIKTAFDAKQKTATTLREVRNKEEECLTPLNKADSHMRHLRLDYKTEQDKKDRVAREKAEEAAQKLAKKEADKLLKKAEKASDIVTEEKLIEKADEVKIAPVFIPKTVKQSERTETGTLNTFVSEIKIEVHDVRSIAGMVYKGELPVNVLTVNEAKIKTWVKMYDRKSGMYDGFNVSIIEKERITLRK